MAIMLVVIPVVAGALSFAIRSNVCRRGVLVSAAAAHAALTVWVVCHTQVDTSGWIGFDDLGKLFLSLTSILFLGMVVYVLGFLNREKSKGEATFTGCLLLFLGTMTLVAGTRHFGLLWVAMEATTLVSAPLIYFHKSEQSLEASWKYLLICSVGIALALLGNLFLALSWPQDDSGDFSLILDRMLTVAPQLNSKWLQIAFIFFLIGYGTKMGLVPMHTWLPDAHSEAPAAVSALLSGALLNCAFLGIMRAHQLMIAAGEMAFDCSLLKTFGILSIAVASIFVVAQVDFKRMLAYSSIENMGLAALGLGLGGDAVFGSMLHLVNHSLVKAMLFCVAGNILVIYRTRRVDEVGGILKVSPITGVLWLAGFLAISGVPPFGMFSSKLIMLRQAVATGSWGMLGGMVLLLVIVFGGMALIFIKTSQGESTLKRDTSAEPVIKNALLANLPPIVFCLLSFSIGIYLPDGIVAFLSQVASALGGQP